jgi:hypothetical protein
MAEAGAPFVRLKATLMGVFGMLQSLPGALRARQMILLSAVLLGAAVGVGRDVVKFRRPLMVLVMRAVVVSGGHKLNAHNLPGFGMGFLGQFIRVLGVFQGALGMPASALVIPFFVVLGCRAMRVRRPFVFLRCSSV